MDKLQASYDGAGGPRFLGQAYNEPSSATNYSPPRVANNQNIVVLGKLPPMNIAYGKEIQGDGVGGPGLGGFLDFTSKNRPPYDSPETNDIMQSVPPPGSIQGQAADGGRGWNPTGGGGQGGRQLKQLFGNIFRPGGLSGGYREQDPAGTSKGGLIQRLGFPEYKPFKDSSSSMAEALDAEAKSEKTGAATRAALATGADPSSATTTPTTAGADAPAKGLRTDRHNNPTAFTIDVAAQAGLVLGIDYKQGDPFQDAGGRTLYTAKLLKDPVQTTIDVIDNIGFYTASGKPRWSYIDIIPEAKNWNNLTNAQKTTVIDRMYEIENKTASGPSTGLSTGLSTGPSKVVPGAGYPGVQEAVESSRSPTMYAFETMTDPSNIITGGKTYGQAIVENQANLWDRYNIGGLQEQEDTYRRLGATLPDDLVSYVRGRDEYLNRTDQMINEFIAGLPTTTDMSDPLNQTKSKDYLNYLYTLRGAQNQRYIDYVNTSVTKHTADLQNISDNLGTALSAYQSELQATNIMTTDMYNTYRAALVDLYNNVQDAPLRAKQLQLLNEQVIAAAAQNVSAGSKALDQYNYIEDAAELDDHMLDSKGYLLRQVEGNLIGLIDEYMAIQPTMNPRSIVTQYAAGVGRILWAGPDAEREDKAPITLQEKIRIAENAIDEFTTVATLQTFPDAYTVGIDNAEAIKNKMSSLLGNTLNQGGIPQALRKAVSSLDAKGRFGIGERDVTEQEFIKKFEEETTRAGMSEELARLLAESIYVEFLQWITTSMVNGKTIVGSTPEEFVKYYFHDLQSTTDRAKEEPKPFSDSEFAWNVANSYITRFYQAMLREKGLILKDDQPEQE
jgi:hypothetical protein